MVIWVFFIVFYLIENGIKVADHERIADELQQLLDEQAQLRASLAEQNVDPDLIDRIRHCVDTVIKAGEEPRQRESIRAQLEESLHRNSDINQQKQTNLHPNTPQKRTEDYRA